MPKKKHPNTSYHPSSGDLYTPVTAEVIALLIRMKLKHRFWRDVSAISGTKLRVVRRLRYGEYKTVSMSLLDRMITTTGVGSIEDFVWFTADDLVALGIWDPPAEALDGGEAGVEKTAPKPKKGNLPERIEWDNPGTAETTDSGLRHRKRRERGK